MSPSNRDDLVDPIDPTTRYEHRDANARNVALTGFGVLVGMWIAVMLIYPIFLLFGHLVSRPVLPSSLPPQTGFVLPPAPALQPNPRRDLHEYLAAENADLSTYRWVDPAKGIVSIPIDRAIELIAQRGIPPQPAPPDMTYFDPQAGTRRTGFEGKVVPEPR
ncbi:MAG TPA: hypothetical protein VMB03_23685 [Bryobacteraceae bacterium]|nr:hypothetical protein [Bryobacteraceae bacterium]